MKNLMKSKALSNYFIDKANFEAYNVFDMSNIFYKFNQDTLIPATVTRNGKQTPVWMQQRWEDGEYAVYVRQSGCGHCCTSMVLNLLGIEINPHEHVKRCVKRWGEPKISKNGNQQYYFLTPKGIVDSLASFGVEAKCYGHKSQGVDSAMEHIINSLKDGKMVIFISSPLETFKENPFSKGDHYVLALGITDEGKIIIANSSTNGVYEIGEGIQIVDRETIKKSLNPIAEPLKETWGEIVDLHLGIGYIVVE